MNLAVPWENGYNESFDGKIFYTLNEAQSLIECWRREHNTVRPHSALGYQPPASATAILQDLVVRATASDIPRLIKFAKTLGLYRRGILASYDYFISTCPSEGTNNQIRTMERQAYGFRDQEFFKLEILDSLETKYGLVG